MADLPDAMPLADLLRQLREVLSGALPADEATREARWITAHALACSAADLTLHRMPISETQRITALNWANQRATGMPLAYVLGDVAFHTLDLACAPGVLIPRPDTEVLVDAVLGVLPTDRPIRVLDLGTGSGAIALAILNQRPMAVAVGLDLSPLACALARQNAERCGLTHRFEVIEADFSAAPMGPFDLIVSNPPYIETETIAKLDQSVRDFEPHLALDGGADGLDAYRVLFQLIPARLTNAGVWAVEIGFNQGETVPALARKYGLRVCEVRSDLNQHPRVVWGMLC